jgi:hypothetical protein
VPATRTEPSGPGVPAANATSRSVAYPGSQRRPASAQTRPNRAATGGVRSADTPATPITDASTWPGSTLASAARSAALDAAAAPSGWLTGLPAAAMLRPVPARRSRPPGCASRSPRGRRRGPTTPCAGRSIQREWTIVAPAGS